MSHNNAVFSCRITLVKMDVSQWRKCLGYLTFEVTKKTLENTTQMENTVESETQEYMRDHKKTHLPMLRPTQINDTCFHNVFFFSVKLIRGFKSFLVNSLLYSQFTNVCLQHKETEVYGHYQDFICQLEAPNIPITDSASVFLGDEKCAILQKWCIDDGATELDHQQQNVPEQCGGDLKTAVLKVFHYISWAPIVYWCYCLECVALA